MGAFIRGGAFIRDNTVCIFLFTYEQSWKNTNVRYLYILRLIFIELTRGPNYYTCLLGSNALHNSYSACQGLT